ncbi:mediator complex subunit MED18 [Cardiosporidium cionae]|uniref:Mediator complex subunit MED18 n=1 Tax=Cardiosporidium cionae TaxID=476202 RepID=A0ABQ7JDF0_9APIC|nr:mediator complex subunit MED18 [Cardiosporidium cionae]|eukprot:KAF8822024.1 mediator complex subunit MED18 [Cardiosporidium cionae]
MDQWDTRCTDAQETRVGHSANQLQIRHVLRHFGTGYIMRAEKNAKTNVHRLIEAKVDPAMWNVLSMLGFRQKGHIFCKAEIYHSKYGSSNHIMVTIQTHFTDKEMQHCLLPSAHLLRVVGQCTNDTQYEAIEGQVLAFATKLKEFVKLKKTERSELQEAISEFMESSFSAKLPH